MVQKEEQVSFAIEIRFNWKFGTHRTLSRTKLDENTTRPTCVTLAIDPSGSVTVLLCMSFEVVSNFGLQTI